jgi:hypothetical protein
MRYAIALLFAISCVAYTQDLTTKLNAAPSTLEQVLYVADGTDLYTYDIDPQTFQPSLMGTIPLPKPQVNGLAASSHGRFLYVMASDPYPATDSRIYVYDTTGYGVQECRCSPFRRPTSPLCLSIPPITSCMP